MHANPSRISDANTRGCTRGVHTKPPIKEIAFVHPRTYTCVLMYSRPTRKSHQNTQRYQACPPMRDHPTHRECPLHPCGVWTASWCDRCDTSAADPRSPAAPTDHIRSSAHPKSRRANDRPVPFRSTACVSCPPIGSWRGRGACQPAGCRRSSGLRSDRPPGPTHPAAWRRATGAR